MIDENTRKLLEEARTMIRDGIVFKYQDGDLHDSPDGLISRLSEALGEQYDITKGEVVPLPPKTPRTPLTRENILAWAVQYAKDHPTDEGLPTPERVLADLLLAYNYDANYSNYDRGDLLDTVRDWLHRGVKGFLQYTRTELLDEIWDELCEPDNSQFQFADVEELVAEFGPKYDEPDETAC